MSFNPNVMRDSHPTLQKYGINASSIKLLLNHPSRDFHWSKISKINISSFNIGMKKLLHKTRH